jgi:hypothetical protein
MASVLNYLITIIQDFSSINVLVFVQQYKCLIDNIIALNKKKPFKLL